LPGTESTHLETADGLQTRTAQASAPALKQTALEAEHVRRASEHVANQTEYVLSAAKRTAAAQINTFKRSGMGHRCLEDVCTMKSGVFDFRLQACVRLPYVRGGVAEPTISEMQSVQVFRQRW